MKCKEINSSAKLKTYGYFDESKQIAECTIKIKKDSFYLEKVLVESEYRGLGLCKKFLSCVLKNFKKPVYLTVLKNNEPAIKCYQSLGFKTIDEGQSTFYMEK
jgi:ribosomal protein S18 acetylase RimI-like enzyme